MKSLLVILVLCALAETTQAYKYNSCCDLGHLEFDFIEALEDFKHAVMYVALTPGYNCTQLEYNAKTRTETLYKTDQTIEHYKVTQPTKGTIHRKNTETGDVIKTTAFLYHKGHPDERSVLCSYTCDDDGKHVAAIQCLIKSKKSTDSVCLVNTLFVYDINPELYNNQELQICLRSHSSNY